MVTHLCVIFTFLKLPVASCQFRAAIAIKSKFMIISKWHQTNKKFMLLHCWRAVEVSGFFQLSESEEYWAPCFRLDRRTLILLLPSPV